MSIPFPMTHQCYEGIFSTIEVFSAPKINETSNEDQFSVSSHVIGEEIEGRVCLCDGASCAPLSGEWAKYLSLWLTSSDRDVTEHNLPKLISQVGQYASNWKIMQDALTNAFNDSCRSNNVPASTVGFLSVIPMDDGSTLIRGLFVGDTCVFIRRTDCRHITSMVREDGISTEILNDHYSFPLKNSDQFSNAPDLAVSIPDSSRVVRGRVRSMESKIEGEFIVVLATDAISKWIIDRINAGEDPYTEIQKARTSEKSFRIWLEGQRGAGAIANDDSTMILFERGFGSRPQNPVGDNVQQSTALAGTVQQTSLSVVELPVKYPSEESCSEAVSVALKNDKTIFGIPTGIGEKVLQTGGSIDFTTKLCRSINGESFLVGELKGLVNCNQEKFYFQKREDLVLRMSCKDKGDFAVKILFKDPEGKIEENLSIVAERSAGLSHLNKFKFYKRALAITDGKVPFEAPPRHYSIIITKWSGHSKNFIDFFNSNIVKKLGGEESLKIGAQVLAKRLQEQYMEALRELDNNGLVNIQPLPSNFEIFEIGTRLVFTEENALAPHAIGTILENKVKAQINTNSWFIPLACMAAILVPERVKKIATNRQLVSLSQKIPIESQVARGLDQLIQLVKNRKMVLSSKEIEECGFNLFNPDDVVNLASTLSRCRLE